MNVVRARRLAVCFLAVLLLFSVTVSAADAIVTLDNNQYNSFISNFTSIYDVLSKIFIDVGVITEDTGKIVSALSTLRTNLSVADMIYDIHFASIASQSHLNGMSTNVNYIVSLLQDGSIDTIGTVLSQINLQLQDLPGIHDDLQTLDSVVDQLLTNSNAMKTSLQSIAGTNTTLVYGLDALHDDFNTQIRLANGSLTSLTDGMDKLVEVFASSEDLALKDKTKDSIVAVKDNIPDTASSIPILLDFRHFFDVEGVDVDFSQFGPILISYLESWYSSSTQSSLSVGGGVSSYSARSSYSSTPLYDSNVASIKEMFGID